MSDPARPRMAVTLGDPAGIGGELVAKLLSDPETSTVADIVLISDETELATAGTDAGIPIDYGYEPEQGKPVLHHTTATRPAEGFQRKVATKEGGRWALENLEIALGMAKSGAVDAILYAPLNKSSLHQAGMQAQDELRWFEERLEETGATSELNVLPGLWTARVTSHVSIADVDKGINRENVVAAGSLLHTVLRETGIAEPRIGVCALNPHAGENGSFGRHELDIIGPAVEDLRAQELDFSGPFPSDTIFLRREQFDGILTMYHDQGQIAMKLLGFDGGVTMSGGLRIPICTPAHGTAFDLVGKGIANTGSIRNAFDIATTIATRRKR